MPLPSSYCMMDQQNSAPDANFTCMRGPPRETCIESDRPEPGPGLAGLVRSPVRILSAVRLLPRRAPGQVWTLTSQSGSVWCAQPAVRDCGVREPAPAATALTSRLAWPAGSHGPPSTNRRLLTAAMDYHSSLELVPLSSSQSDSPGSGWHAPPLAVELPVRVENPRPRRSTPPASSGPQRALGSRPQGGRRRARSRLWLTRCSNFGFDLIRSARIPQNRAGTRPISFARLRRALACGAEVIFRRRAEKRSCFEEFRRVTKSCAAKRFPGPTPAPGPGEGGHPVSV